MKATEALARLAFGRHMDDHASERLMALRRRDDRGDEVAGLNRAQVLELCARLASYAEAGAAPKDLLVKAGDDAFRRFTDDAEVLVAVGRMYLMGEDLPKAERSLRRATRLAPRDPHALRLFGEVMLRLGEPTEAHAALAGAVASGMNDPWTKVWVSRALDYAELLPDLGVEGVARDVRQVLGKPGQGPADQDRRPALQVLAPEPRARIHKAPVGRIDKGIFFAGDPRAELPDLHRAPPSLDAGEIVDLPTPTSGGIGHTDLGVASPGAAPERPAKGGALPDALASDASWGRPPPSDPVPSSAPASDTEISAFVPELEHLRAGNPTPAPEVGGQARPAGGHRSTAGEPLPRLTAGELVDEFTDHKRPRQSAPQRAAAAASPPAADRPRRGPPPLPPEPPRAAPPEPATAISMPTPVQASAAPRITILDADGPGPVTAPPSALIPLDGPVTAPPSALIPLDGPGSSARDAAPPSALMPPEPPSLQVPSALLLGRPVPDAEVRPPGAPPIAPADKAAPRPAPAPEKRRSRLQSLLIRAVVALAIAAVVAGAFQLYKRNRSTKLRAFSAQASIALQIGGPRGVADAEAALAGARRIDPRSRTVALSTVKLRFFTVLDVDAARVPDLVAAIEEAGAAGVRSSDMAFAQVARAAASGDAASAVEIIAHHDEDPDRANDALYQLAAAAAIEPQDPTAAVERYRAAAKLDPQLLSVQIRLARALAFSGSAAAAKEVVTALREKWPGRPEVTALAALVAVAEPGTTTALLDLDTDPDMLPRPLRAAARALAKGGGDQVIATATSEADIAPVIVLCGEIALRAGHEASARDAAHRAIELTTTYAPAYALAARVALASGRFEEARQAALRAPADVAAEVLALIAYEAGDLDAMTKAAGPRAGGPATEPVAAGVSRLRAVEPMSTSTVSALVKAGKPWADVIAMDAALDAGALELAVSISSAWSGADKHPIRAARIARLLRYQGKNGAAQAAAASAAPTTAARVEGALAAAEMASARLAAATTMQSSRTDEERWVAVFLLAREGRSGPARVLMRTLPYPTAGSPLLLRTVAALALGELHIKNPTHPMITSLQVWTRNPDVARALGVPLPTAPAAEDGAAPAPPPKPKLFGKIPRPNADPY